MGGVIDDGFGIANITSPHNAAIDRVQAELRQDSDVRDKWKRELEFLEKGGNPLDYKLGDSASVGVQSTSFVGWQPDQFISSEAKGRFLYGAIPHGDSVENSDKPQAPICGPNSADNFLLFDAEPVISEGDQNSSQPSRGETEPLERSLQIAGNRINRQHGDSVTFGLPGKAYKRRNRSRPNRDGGRLTSNNLNPSRSSNGSSLDAQLSTKDVKGLVSNGEHQLASLNWNLKFEIPVDNIPRENLLTEGVQQESELERLRLAGSTKDRKTNVLVAAAKEANISMNFTDVKSKRESPSAAVTLSQMNFGGPDAIQSTEQMTSVSVECCPCETATEYENERRSCQANGRKCEVIKRDANNNASINPSVKDLDLESSSTPTHTSNDGNNDDQDFTAKGVIKLVNKENHSERFDCSTFVKSKEEQENGFAPAPEEECNRTLSALGNRTVDHATLRVTENCGSIPSESGTKSTNPVCDNPDLENAADHPFEQQDFVDSSIQDLSGTGLVNGGSPVPILKASSISTLIVASMIDEDTILKEAQKIQAKRRRIAELSVAVSSTEVLQRSHWDYVLEEMAWLANDFSQECIWKRAAAAQISHRTAFTYLSRKQVNTSSMEVKKVAHKLARAVMDFWLSVDMQTEATREELEQQRKKNGALSVRAYAVRFLYYNRGKIFHNQVEVPMTPDGISDYGYPDVSQDDTLLKENLIYAVPRGAMQAYIKAIESRVAHFEIIGHSGQEDVETSACDAVTVFHSQSTTYSEHESETSTYNMSEAFESSKSSRFAQLKRKQMTHAGGATPCGIRSGLLPMQSAENKFSGQRSVLTAKRPGSNQNVPIATKRVRTAPRRVITPFSAAASGCMQVPNKPDSSSGDTNSYQEDENILRCGVLLPNCLEVESAEDFEKQLPFDSAEVSTNKPKKRKKAKHIVHFNQNCNYKQRRAVGSIFQNEQRDHLKKRSESHQLESNGNSGLLGQPMMKKPKIVHESLDISFDNIPPRAASVPSPAASQMSNMSGSNKFIKGISGQDHFKKDKALKSPSRRLVAGSPWSLFEDQALVVLVHDLGPNWELVSDALNSPLRLKCIFRKAQECKERHSALMDRTPGDGADSAEESGSSQAYPSTLPNIPQGSAGHLFQQLQGPIEEATLKSFFEKIIIIMHKQHAHKTQDRKQIQPPHSSHATALSQVCPNNLNGGHVLTPLDLCDDKLSVSDMLLLGYQGAPTSGLAIANQGNINPLLPASSPNPAFQGSPNVLVGNNLSSSSGHLNSSIIYPVPGSSSVSAEEQQRLHLYNQMVSGRNILPSDVSSPGELPRNERGVHVLPCGNNMGSLINRSLPMVGPGLQEIFNSGTVVSSGMQSACISPGHGNAVPRPHESLHMMRLDMGPEEQWQMTMPEHQMSGNGQGVVSPFVGLSAPLASQTSPVLAYSRSHPRSPQQPHHPHLRARRNHPPNAQQRAYVMRLAKEKQLQRFLQQQQQQKYAASNNSLMPNMQSRKLPISSPMPDSSQVQTYTISPVVIPPLTTVSSVNSMPQLQHKHQTPSKVVIRGNTKVGGSGLAGQTGKRRQKLQEQPSSQANRQHPPQRTQLQAHQPSSQAKAGKGVSRRNTMHQNISIVSSLLNGDSANAGIQFSEKEPETNVMQCQPSCTSSVVSPVQPAGQYVASPSDNQSMPQQKQCGTSLPNNLPKTSHAHLQPVTPVLSSGLQSAPSLAMAGSSLQQTSYNQRLLNQNKVVLQRAAKSNGQVDSGPSTKLPRNDFDQNPMNSSSVMDAVTPSPQTSYDSANITQNASPSSAHQWHASEQLLECNAVNSATNLDSLVPTTSNMGLTVSQTGQGLPKKPASGSISHEFGAQNESSLNQPTQHQAQLQQSGRSDDPLE